MKQGWLKLVIAVGSVAVLIAISAGFFLSKGARTGRQVELYKEELRAAGEILDIRHISTNAPAGATNVAALMQTVGRVLSTRFGNAFDTNNPGGMVATSPGRAIVVWQQPYLLDGSGSNSWEEMRLALDQYQTALNLLQTIPEGVRIEFPLDYDGGFFLALPHLVQMKQSAQLLGAATVCDLNTGNTASAIANMMALLRLMDSWSGEPLLISQLVLIAMESTAFSFQWELLQSTHLSDQQLLDLQKGWARLDLLSSAERAMLGERALMSLTFEQLRATNHPSGVVGYGGGSSGGASLWDAIKEDAAVMKTRATDTMWRSNWSYDDELLMLKADQLFLDALRKVRTNGHFGTVPQEIAERTEKLVRQQQADSRIRMILQDGMMGLLSSPMTFGKSMEKVLLAEAQKRIAIAAIGLKRYQLRHGTFPESLDRLVPEFLPSELLDPVDGKPLRYEPRPEGLFVLYSIGKDGKDDGGIATPARKKSPSFANGMDWVWPQPATATETEAFRTSGFHP